MKGYLIIKTKFWKEDQINILSIFFNWFNKRSFQKIQTNFKQMRFRIFLVQLIFSKVIQPLLCTGITFLPIRVIALCQMPLPLTQLLLDEMHLTPTKCGEHSSVSYNCFSHQTLQKVLRINVRLMFTSKFSEILQRQQLSIFLCSIKDSMHQSKHPSNEKTNQTNKKQFYHIFNIFHKRKFR